MCQLTYAEVNKRANPARMAKDYASKNKGTGTARERDLETKQSKMKTRNNLYNQICSIENLNLADDKARKGKVYQYGIKQHDKHRESNILLLREMLLNKTYRTSAYKKFTIHDPKEREIFCLPYFPDRIIHHAIMNILEPVFVSVFTADTYSCIKGKGIHGALRAIKKALLDKTGTRYCLKLDIKKFYPSIDHAILKALLRKIIKDSDLLMLLDEIIDSADGVPIGNYLSQYFANFYMAYFDHWIKEVKRVKYYFRYADDLVIFSGDKESLHKLLVEIREYLGDHLKLTAKDNYQIFPVDARGLDFVGYRFYHTHILLRKRIKQRFIKMLKYRKNDKSIASYKGWIQHCNGKHLLKKLLHE